MGRPVAQLKRVMSRKEFAEWCAYVQAYGPLDFARMYDLPAARIALTVNHSVGGKAELQHFLPYQPKAFADFSDVDLQVLKALGNTTQ